MNITALTLATLPLADWFQSSAGQQWIVAILLCFVFISFIREWFPVEITSLCAAALLMIFGILDSKEVLTSFANSGPLTVVCMFILSASLEKTGLIAELSKLFNKISKGNELIALIAITLGALAVSPFVNNTPVVVILMPVVLSFCREHGIAPSKLLIPLSFATILGGTCSIIGTSTNVVVLGQVQKLGYDAVKMFTMTPMGLLYAIAGLAYIWIFGRKILPNRETLSTLLPQEAQRDFLLQMRIVNNSPFIGATPLELTRTELNGMRIIEVRRKGVTLQDELTQITLQEGDRLLVLCGKKKISQAREARGVDLGWDESRGLEALEQRDVLIVEGMVDIGSEFAGHTLEELKLRQKFNVLVLAIHRHGKNITNDLNQNTRLNEGDTLLLEGAQNGMERLLRKRRLIPLSRKIVEVHNKNKRVWAIAAMAIFILFGLLGSFEQYGAFFAFFAQFDPFYLAFVAALLVIMAGCIKPREAYRSVDWSIIFLILGMLCVGDAMSKTGLARTIAEAVVGSVGTLGPLFMLSVMYMLCSTITEMVSNNAVAAIMAPLAYEMAIKFGVDPMPFIMAVMFGASASFATPIGYQTNTYVYNAGGYKFSDFLKIGGPLNIILWIVFTLAAPIFFPF